MKGKRIYLAVGPLLLVALLLCSGCTYLESAGTGAFLGAIPGAIIGHQSGRAGEGAAIGAGVGALAGLIYNAERQSIMTQQQLDQANTIFVRLQANDGTFRDIRLVRHPEGWMGPGGEVYPGNVPSAEQLKQRYGI